MQLNLLIVISSYDLFDERFSIEVKEFSKYYSKINLNVFQCRNEQDVLKAISKNSEVEVLLVQLAPITKKVIKKIPYCKVIGRYANGVDNIDITNASQAGILVVNVPDYCLDEVSNHAISLILSLAQKLGFYFSKTRGGEYNWSLGRPINKIREKYLGFVSFGKIAREVSKKANVFGFKMLAFDPYVDYKEMKKFNVKKVNFLELLSQSDYISIHAPLNESTRHLFSFDEFKKMKNSAYLINTSRGAIIDEKALFDALSKNIIAGAALDVLEKEPSDGIIKKSSLIQLKNLYITPHTAWYTEESIISLREKLSHNVMDALNGKENYGIVNSHILKNKNY